VAPAATTSALADLELRVAVPADAPELLVLQRACWMPEGRVSGEWHIPPLEESLDDVVSGLAEWTTWVARVPADGNAQGRLVASARGRLRPGDPSVWETGRLMVAPDLQGRGLGRALLEHAEAAAPGSVTTFWINTGRVSEGNLRRYKRAGYRIVPGEGTFPGTVDLVRPRR
jgi:tRNA (guanine37-N1)-methyltransferase